MQGLFNSLHFLNFKQVSTATFAAIFDWIILICCFSVRNTRTDVFLNLSIFVLGASVGWLIGVLIAPYTAKEQTEFAQYVGIVSTFVSGYLVAKLDPTITKILSPDYLLALTATAGFRVIVFSSSLLVATLITFVFRKYA
jgi:hypothetical protein